MIDVQCPNEGAMRSPLDHLSRGVQHHGTSDYIPDVPYKEGTFKGTGPLIASLLRCGP